MAAGVANKDSPKYFTILLTTQVFRHPTCSTNNKDYALKEITSLKKKITEAENEWLESFLELNGLTNLVDAISKYELRFRNTK